MFSIGDKVKILDRDISGLRHRKNWNGRITHINGAYILVRPMWTNREIEFYPNELKKIK